MSTEIRNRGVGVGGFDPSNLHLKKELTQIRKAARALRDPGTTSSWRSPLSSARSAAAKHYYHHHKNDLSKHQTTNFKEYSNGEFQPQLQLSIVGNDSTNSNNNNTNYNSHDGNGKEKAKKVYLYNWRSHKSESERSRLCNEDEEAENGHGDDDIERSSSSQEAEESVEDSLSDARHCGNDSKSDTYISDKYASMIFNCKDTTLTTPSIRRSVKKKSKKNHYSSSIPRHHGEKLKQQILLSRSAKRALAGFGRDDLSSLVDQSDDTEDYCNSEDLRRASAASPLLARLKNKHWTHSSAKLLRSSRRDDSSYTYSTPALSTSSYNRYAVRYPSTVGSWDATTASLIDGDEDGDDQLDLPGRQGCGIPCYWSRRSTPKSKGGGGSYFSPSLSDTLRRKGSTILCGSHSMYKRSRRGSSLGYNKRRSGSRAAAQGLLPLLTSNGDGQNGSSIGTGNSDDELSTNFGELDLEALSRLDGRRWSTSCRSQEGLELVALNGEEEEEGTPENIRSLSQKYRPMFFEEIIGQNIVVQSLINAVSRKRIAPVYLFQGPRGTGKTSTARVFAASLNCLASEETKPCGLCRECNEFVSGKSRDLIEVDGTNKKGIDSIRYLIKGLLPGSSSTFSRYKVFIIDECHLLPTKAWMALLKFLEEPPPRVVFILISTDLDNVPRTVLSRCQKYLFNKIRDSDILARLRKIAAEENLDVESDALDLIAVNADGSLRDAETMIDQLSLLGKRITTSLVNELVGVVSDEKLLELLELAMSSDTAETVKRAREMLDSGVDPIVLMSQMATLIMDIIAGTYHNLDGKHQGSFFSGRSLTDSELERLKRALRLLSEAEKQLRVSSERSTWFTATLLQLGSVSSPDPTHSGSSRRQSSKTTEEEPSSTFKDSISDPQRSDPHHAFRKSCSPTSFLKADHRKSKSKEENLPLMDTMSFSSKPAQNQLINGDILDEYVTGKTISRSMNSKMLDDIWVRCVEKCHSKTLRQLLHTYGRLISISVVEGLFVAYIAFGDSDIKTRAERFHSSITNSFETVLRSNIEVRILLLPDGDASINGLKPDVLLDSLSQRQMSSVTLLNSEHTAVCSSEVDGYSNGDSYHQEALKISKGSLNDSEEKQAAGVLVSSAGNSKTNGAKDRKSEIPVQRIESIIHEQRLETAWLQAMEKGTPGSASRLRPERNQVLPQDGVIYHQNQLEPSNPLDLSSQNWEDELNHETKSLKIDDEKTLNLKKDQISKRLDCYPISPSLLHDNSFAGNFVKENSGYESGPGGGGCSGLFCWNNTKTNRRIKGTPVRPHKGVRFLWFGECVKAQRNETRFRR